MKNILLTITYDGTFFSGWQRQVAQRTVQGEIEKVLSQLWHEGIKLNGTSRTDAGVHAYGQRANFYLEAPVPVDRIKYIVNNKLPGDIRICEAIEVSEVFHARFDAAGKKYMYRIDNQAEKDIFTRNYCYPVQKQLDIVPMRQAALHLVGTHDFRSFMAAGGQERESTVRTIHSLELINDGYSVNLEITGDGFLYNMVRIITGTLVDVGLGKIRPEQTPDILAAKDRQKAGHTAPPGGLYLAEIYFKEASF